MKYIPFVNIKHGTKSVHRYSNGNTLPLVQLPFAMCGFSAQTKYDGGWWYYPDHRFLEGVRLERRGKKILPVLACCGVKEFAEQQGGVGRTARRAEAQGAGQHNLVLRIVIRSRVFVRMRHGYA